MSKTGTRTITGIMALLAAALGVWATMVWTATPGDSTDGVRRTVYALREGKRLVRLEDKQGHTAYEVEDSTGHRLFAVPVHDCLLAGEFRDGRLDFRMKATGQTGYIDDRGTVYLEETRLPGPDEGKNTAQITAPAEQDRPEDGNAKEEERPRKATPKQEFIEQADLRRMARSNPFYSEAAKVMAGKLEVDDSTSRHRILDYCEHFRTAYTRKDMAFLRQVFSDKALIIVGSVVRDAPDNQGMQPAPQVKYSLRTKEEYLKRLEQVFGSNRKIKVQFTGFRIMRHPSVDGIYGVSLRQRYTSDRYSDDGYLFLLWDFRNPQRPLIHVRTWQPAADVSGGTGPIDLSDFNLN